MPEGGEKGLCPDWRERGWGGRKIKKMTSETNEHEKSRKKNGEEKNSKQLRDRATHNLIKMGREGQKHGPQGKRGKGS